MSQTATILVIDDEPQIRKFLRISLASQGYKVIEAGTGNEGLAQAALSKQDLLVLDLGLPDMDGQQVLREFREWSSKPVKRWWSVARCTSWAIATWVITAS